MTKMIRYSFVLAFTLCLAFTAQAQKFGYTSSQAILLELPDVKRADSKLKDLESQLQKKGEQMVQRYQTKRQDLEKRYADGNVSQVQLENELKVLTDEEKKIVQYEQDMMNQLANKRAELIQPILERVQQAIDDVAAEQGYQYVFDQSTGVLLYAKEEDDITDKVKAKLGM